MKNLFSIYRIFPRIFKQSLWSSNYTASCIFRNKNFYKTNIYRSRSYCTQCEFWPAGNFPPATEWGYDKPGPETWPTKYPQAGGTHQSPIDIDTSLVKPGDFEDPLKWKYAPGICKSIVNTGCGWRVDIDGTDTEVSGGPLSNSYQLVQFHGHWGSCSTCGSEHTVDGKSYAAELHFVHWNKDEYSSCAEAVSCQRGLTVIGVLVEVGEANSELEKLCETIQSILNKDELLNLETDVDPVLMYPANKDYWTYSGSLTTPPCYESVTWILFKEPITISEEQLNCFRQMKKPSADESGDDCGCVVQNFRPPQPLNDREIFEASC